MLYKGYKILNIANTIKVFYPDDIASAVAPGSIMAAKKMIDNHIFKTVDIDMYVQGEKGIVMPEQKPAAVYSNKNWAA